MASIGTAFNITTGALEADQAALSIVSNNVANVNTPGYTREVPAWQTADTLQINGITYGDGVNLSGPQSQRNPVLQQSLDQQTQAESDSAARLTALNQVQSIFSSSISTNSSSTSATVGISQDLSSFFSAWSALEASPSQTSLRQEVLSAAANLASDFNSAAGQLTSQAASVDQQSASLVGQINNLTSQIAQLNAQISSQSPNTDAGSLEDARQAAISQLGSL